MLADKHCKNAIRPPDNSGNRRRRETRTSSVRLSPLLSIHNLARSHSRDRIWPMFSKECDRQIEFGWLQRDRLAPARALPVTSSKR
jgi:hypothetical protein